MYRRWIVGLALASLISGVTAAAAQDSRPTKLEGACGEALARFCPDLSATPGQTRNQMICLKPYRTSLKPSCRAAVNAAMK